MNPMTAPRDPDSDHLLRRVAAGDPAARELLLDRHRQRLRRMIALRLDRRLWARVDPSDVLQETLAEAGQKLPDYARTRPLPFYAWLRQIAAQGRSAWRVLSGYTRRVSRRIPCTGSSRYSGDGSGRGSTPRNAPKRW